MKVTKRMSATWEPRHARLESMADAYWLARKEGDEERAARIWSDMDGVPRDVGASETETLGKLADFLDLDFSPETHTGRGVAPGFCGWYGNISDAMGDDNTAFLVLTALHEAGAITRSDYMATLDGPAIDYTFVTRLTLDGKTYGASYAEGDFRITLSPTGHFADGNIHILEALPYRETPDDRWLKTLEGWIQDSMKESSYAPVPSVSAREWLAKYPAQVST